MLSRIVFTLQLFIRWIVYVPKRRYDTRMITLTEIDSIFAIPN